MITDINIGIVTEDLARFWLIYVAKLRKSLCFDFNLPTHLSQVLLSTELFFHKNCKPTRFSDSCQFLNTPSRSRKKYPSISCLMIEQCLPIFMLQLSCVIRSYQHMLSCFFIRPVFPIKNCITIVAQLFSYAPIRIKLQDTKFCPGSFHFSSPAFVGGLFSNTFVLLVLLRRFFNFLILFLSSVFTCWATDRSKAAKTSFYMFMSLFVDVFPGAIGPLHPFSLHIFCKRRDRPM